MKQSGPEDKIIMTKSGSDKIIMTQSDSDDKTSMTQFDPDDKIMIYFAPDVCFRLALMIRLLFQHGLYVKTLSVPDYHNCFSMAFMLRLILALIIKLLFQHGLYVKTHFGPDYKIIMYSV